MRITLLMMMITLLATGIIGIAIAGDNKPVTLEERFSYGLGLRMGTDFKARGYAVDPDLLLQGLQDALEGKEPLMTMDEAQAAMMELSQISQKKAAGEKMAEGEKFLAENAKKEGVKTTASGLQYKELQAGTGEMPTANDQVKVHYKGSLLNGQEFDSSYKRGEPATFGVGQVIKGWTEGLQLMKEGSKYELYIPADLAYGDQGAGRAIGPGETLIFEVELIEIIK